MTRHPATAPALRPRVRLPMLAVLLAVALPATVLPAWAGTPIDQTRPLDARGTVQIENLKGRIQVRVWDREEVHVGGTLGDGVEKLVVDGNRRNLLVRVQYPRGNTMGNRTQPTELILDVPRLASLEIESVSADVDVLGTAGRELEIDSVSGDVVVAGAPGQASIESVSGDLTLTLNSSDVSAESVSGDIRLHGRLGGEVKAQTVSGNSRIDSRGERLRSLTLASVSGDASARVGLADGGRIQAETVSGDVRLQLPASLSARVSGETFSGDLSAPGARIERPKYGPGASFEHRYGDGRGQISIETFSGDAELTID